MMKFLILVLVALSIGISESIHAPENVGNWRLKSALDAYFGIRKEDLDAKCNKETSWPEVVKAFESEEDIFIGSLRQVAAKTKKSSKVTDKVLDVLIDELVQKNNDYTKSITNLAKTTLPCITKEKLSEIMKYRVAFASATIKAFVKERNE